MLRSRLNIRSSSRAKRRRRLIVFWTWVVFITLVIVLGGIITLFRLENFKIKNISISGNSIITKEEIVAQASESLNGFYLYFLPKSNIFIYSKTHLVNTLSSVYKRLDDIEIKSDGWQSIVIEVKERKPFALWCDSTKKVLLDDGKINKDECYFIDNNGFIFARAPDFSGNVFFKYYGQTFDKNIGSNFLLPVEFEKLYFFIEGLKDINLKPISAEAKGVREYVINLEDGGYILIEKNQDFNRLLKDLKVSISSNEELGSINSSFSLDYIDLRFNNKIFYKSKN